MCLFSIEHSFLLFLNAFKSASGTLSLLLNTNDFVFDIVDNTTGYLLNSTCLKLIHILQTFFPFVPHESKQD